MSERAAGDYDRLSVRHLINDEWELSHTRFSRRLKDNRGSEGGFFDSVYSLPDGHHEYFGPQRPQFRFLGAARGPSRGDTHNYDGHVVVLLGTVGPLISGLHKGVVNDFYRRITMSK